MIQEGKVVVGYCIGKDVTKEFHRSVIDLLMYDAATSRRLQDGGGCLDWDSGVNVASARNAICEKFLAKSSAEWLWMIDTDMDFRPDTLERLLKEADPEHAPIVGGLCFGVDKGLYFPTLYDMKGTPEQPEFVRYDTWAPDAMMQVFATGAACLLIHRTALERVRDFENPQRAGMRGFSDAFPWFQETDFYGRCMGEDITFCLRAGFAGLPVHVNTGVQVGHVKSHTLTMDGYLAQKGYLAPTHPGVPA